MKLLFLYLIYSLIIIIIFSFNNPQSYENCELSLKNLNKSCIKCYKNFTLLNGECPCFDHNCNKCSSSFPNSCYKCNNNFILKNGKCLSKIKNCLFYNSISCDQCEQNYILKNGLCEINKNFSCFDKNCEMCSNSKEGFCKICKNGFKLIEGSCKNEKF